MNNIGEELIGVWKVVSLADSLSNGGVSHPLGEKPSGGILYTADGFLSLQLAKDPRPTFADGYHQATREEMKNALEAYVAMYGRYSLDEQESVVTHHILGCNWPDMIGTDQVRPFELSGDTLTLKPAPFEMDGVVHTRRLVLERVRPPQ
jgi:hypothetical protein